MENLIRENYRASLLQIEVEMQGMIAENQDRQNKGLAQAYGEDSFYKLSDRIQALKDLFN